MNTEMVNSIVGSFPDNDYMKTLEHDLHKFQTLQAGFESHYNETLGLVSRGLRSQEVTDKNKNVGQQQMQQEAKRFTSMTSAPEQKLN